MNKLVIVLLGAFIVACTGELTPVTGGDGDGDVDAGAISIEEAEFNSVVKPILSLAGRNLGTCTGCHSGSAVPTIFGSDPALGLAYDTLLGGAMLTNPAAQSQLVIRGAHTGNAFCTGAGVPDAYCLGDEIGPITAWISKEIAAGRVNAQ